MMYLSPSIVLISSDSAQFCERSYKRTITRIEKLSRTIPATLSCSILRPLCTCFLSITIPSPEGEATPETHLRCPLGMRRFLPFDWDPRPSTASLWLAARASQRSRIPYPPIGKGIPLALEAAHHGDHRRSRQVWRENREQLGYTGIRRSTGTHMLISGYNRRSRDAPARSLKTGRLSRIWNPRSCIICLEHTIPAFV